MRTRVGLQLEVKIDRDTSEGDNTVLFGCLSIVFNERYSTYEVIVLAADRLGRAAISSNADNVNGVAVNSYLGVGILNDDAQEIKESIYRRVTSLRFCMIYQ